MASRPPATAARPRSSSPSSTRWRPSLRPQPTSTGLQAIWLYRMIFTPHPLRERMTLFWHNHFATSIAKVQSPPSCSARTTSFAQQALGDFRALLEAIGKDPAMLIWLDSTINRKAKPNENYAREVMELFTLGRGHYTEKDIQEAARAFTGWFVIRDQFEDVPRQHDGGVKYVLGKSGNLTATISPRSCSTSPPAPNSSAASCSAILSATRHASENGCSRRSRRPSASRTFRSRCRSR